MDNVLAPKIKEPNYFFAAETSESPILSKLLAPGNRARGSDWYIDLFEKPAMGHWLVDMSTQYWLYPEQVIENILRSYDPIFIMIRRPTKEQIISYISHLRRGHIENKPISHLYENDAGFAEYLDRMSRWNEDYKAIKRGYSDLNFVDVLFEELISDPATAIKNMIPGLTMRHDFDRNTNKNPRGYPRFQSLNKLFFSDALQKIGRALPHSMYSGLIRLRKSIIRMNLKTGHGEHFEDDKSFVNRTYN